MANIIYPRTVEVSGNISGNGVFPNNITLKNSITLSEVTASTGISASLIYGDGNNIQNLNPGNIDFSDLLSDISSSFGQSVNISSSFGLKEHISASFGQSHNISSSFAELSKTVGQAFAGPITASSLGVGTPVDSPYVDTQQIAQFRKPDGVGSMISVRSGNSQINIGSAAEAVGYNWINSKNSSNAGRDLRLEMGDANSKVIIKSDGKVGIGTTNPDRNFKVIGDAEVSTNFYIGGALTVDTDSLFVDAANNKVGIGTTSPGEKLHVAGNLKVDNDAKIANYNGTTLLYIKDSSGVVGINTDSPDSTKYLHVEGSSKFVGDMTLSGSLLLESGKGISFSAFDNTSGMTSELLDDYEEGTWTPVATNWGNTVEEYNGKYIKIGSMVSVWCSISASSDIDINHHAYISGLPFSPANNAAAFINCRKSDDSAAQNTLSCFIFSGGTIIEFNTDPTTGHRYYYVFASYRV